MPSINGSDVKKVVIACDAGMGSSVMVASTLRSKLSPLGVEVVHTPVNEIPGDATVVLCHQGLAARAQSTAPQAVVVPFAIFMGDPAFTKVEQAIKNGETLES
ncbi:PTS lactose transporter subunit IIB [Demequina muriae]|uniref:PTS lactose transporter subunit IIB n=1 Tax=Demequina muriae TaxID=3051664 RepID=A0ABT8GER3_9MICO|nr:PTS lactose transporter subunit IIB [Demequina sp. EGI L300058]MDN4479924.1 PTS lactose transporter subunit IIB [Demequina sp. EGI L300058]